MINFKRAAAVDPGAGNPERAVLRNAIEARNKAAADVVASSSAAERAREMVSESVHGFQTAKTNVESAKLEAASRLAQAAAGGMVTNAAATMRAARQAETDAADQLDAARAALEVVEAALADAERELQRAEIKVTDAVKAVIASVVPALVVEAARVKAAWAATRAVLKLVQDQIPERPIDPTDRSWRDVLAAKPNPIRELLCEPVVDEAALGPWREWLQALRVDAAAPAPI